jgi:geranylgeranyl diphosphate synthase type I
MPAAADVIDEAQDGELDPAAWPAWEPAVAAGFGLLFKSQQLALAAAPDGARGALALAYAEAGVAMSRGQSADLAARGMPADGGGEAAYLACVKGKTGAAIGLYAAAGAIAAGAPRSAIEALTGWGRAAGGALQLASDLADAMRPESRDLAAMRPTLPLIRAWNRLGEADRPLLEAAWRGDAGAPDLVFVLQRTGAITYSRTRLDALRIEAEMALEAAAEAGELPAPLVAALNNWMVELVLGQEPPPV